MNDPPPLGPREFSTTHWSLVGAAQADTSSETRVRAALEELCRAYWFPLYTFVRGRGYSAAEAEDLTQTFLVRFIETKGFATADRRRGRFRSYLLGSMKHFLANEWHRARRQKRGGGVKFLEWDALAPEARFALEPVQSTNPELDYDREWAVAVISRAKEKLRAECEADGKGALFHTLKGSLSGTEPPRNESAAHLGMSQGAVKVAIHRLRHRYRELLRNEIATTVTTPAEVEDEMRHLIAVLRGK